MNREDRLIFHKLLCQHFDKHEFVNLCHTLSLNPDEVLIGGTHAGNGWQIIQYLERRKELYKLGRYVIEKRPRVNWPEFPSPTISTQELQRKAGEGLRILHQEAHAPEVREAIRHYQTDLKATLESIETVRHYKQLHDLFQEMEVSYNLIIHNERPRLELVGETWDSITSNKPVLDGPINDLIEKAQEHPYHARAAYWLPMVEKGKEAMDASIRKQSLKELDKALRFLYRALDRGLPRVNGHLVDAATDLPLKRLIKSVDSIVHRLEGRWNAELIDHLQHSIQAMIELQTQMETLVNHHNDWQRLDDELRRIDVMTAQDFSELRMMWPDIQGMGMDLYGRSAIQWAIDLRYSNDRLESVLSGQRPPNAIKQEYEAFRRQVSRRFRLVDDQLLQLCEDLRQIGEPLDLLLKSLG